MATITLKSPEGEVNTLQCDEDTTILDALEEAGLDHNYSCRAGSCSSCCMKILEGTLDQEDQFFQMMINLKKDSLSHVLRKPHQIVLLSSQSKKKIYKCAKLFNMIERV